MKLLLFGTGDYYQRYKKWFDREDILALLDNSKEKQGMMLDGIPVLSPEKGVKLSFYVKQMRAQLAGLGVPQGRIFHFFDLHDLCFRKKTEYPVKIYGDVTKAGQALLLSHDLTLGGPAIALFHVAEILIKNGYSVVFASMLDGPLRETLQERHIPVVVDVNLQWKTMNEVSWIKNFQLVFCNTIGYFMFLTNRDQTIPAVWWLHDSSFFYEGIREEVLRSIDRTNLAAFSVGPVPARAIKSMIPDFPVKNLIYGVADHFGRRLERENDRIVFVTIGYIESRKGQDILVDAVEQLSPRVREKAVFYLVGQNTSMLAVRLRHRIENLPQMQMTGTVGRDEVNRILDLADVLICPSREDPMPTVAAEAMMHGAPCLISDATGTADYIEHGVNGFVFQSGDRQQLAALIEYCIEHRSSLSKLGAKARKLYESVFSMDVFERELETMMEQMM